MHKCTVDTVRERLGYVYSSDILQSKNTTSYSIININNINILPKDGCNSYGKTSTADQQTD
jgi:hypothetical protein